MRVLLDENFYWRLQETGYSRAAGVAATTPAVTFLGLGHDLDADPGPGSSRAHAHAMNGQPAPRPSSSTFITVKVASVKPPSV